MGALTADPCMRDTGAQISDGTPLLPRGSLGVEYVRARGNADADGPKPSDLTAVEGRDSCVECAVTFDIDEIGSFEFGAIAVPLTSPCRPPSPRCRTSGCSLNSYEPASEKHCHFFTELDGARERPTPTPSSFGAATTGIIHEEPLRSSIF